MGQEERGLAEEVWEVRGKKIRERIGDLTGLNRKMGKVTLRRHVASVCVYVCKRCCLKGFVVRMKESGYAACFNHNTYITWCTVVQYVTHHLDCCRY